MWLPQVQIVALRNARAGDWTWNMNGHEIERIAAAMNQLRPDWPAASVRTFINKHLLDRPRRDVTIALAWVACESNSATPARVLENGPWWRAVAVEGSNNGRPWDRGSACNVTGQPIERCRATKRPEDEHECMTPHEWDKRVAAEQAARKEGAAQQVVARLDSYTQEEHLSHIEAARHRVKARRERAADAAARLGEDS